MEINNWLNEMKLIKKNYKKERYNSKQKSWAFNIMEANLLDSLSTY